MTIPCPLCGNEQSKLFDQRKFRGQPVTNRSCAACGLVFQSPRMSEAELASYYEREYRLEYQGEEEPNPKDLATQRGRAKSLSGFLRERVGPVKRHLDIGSSAGILLQQIQESYRCESRGVEPGEAYRSYSQAQGLTVYSKLEELEQAEQGRFDLISMAHVLEHLPDPVTSLSHLRTTLLDTQGHLLIEVPNLYAHESFETAHMVSYSAHTLRQVLQKAGFSIVALEAHGRPRSAVIPLYLTALARPVGEETGEEAKIKAESQVGLKRKLGMLRRRTLTRLMPGKAWLQPGKDD
jgi:2-polyprenyl-3-methyl-5-hydroxy-6-metoxy-1,4-benzoquinol methylase